ncbi:thiamine-phosphate pyrophosphorylase [Segniliparus rotundus DSM 44985]|uniref:Thiamine-phosphate synthase n=1 Tax=Segniliparus rotundus (strain ATCC BAA-972 / CDC 1076 / CIP 108378 / DSM 44985 / JCM 13578) TaxID=640132 RepID=D6ZFI0_SEGRD|nr:thiamine phosphate synthase [Segniliparus rotundus]ADG97704.1 thiamine-phosphate pyrophosphorylase [Segniliparus rotundus DSM 44985]
MDSRDARLERLARARLYVCVDARRGTGDLVEFAEAALSGGLDALQLREKSGHNPLEAQDELALLAKLQASTIAHRALLAVNDRADIALACGADMLHLGQRDLPVAIARQIVGPRVLIGRSTHSLPQAQAAIHDPDVDYFCVGPCWSTPTKPGREAVGLELVAQVAALGAEKPWFAIGGIDLERVPQVRSAGASRAVVVRAVTEAEDPRAAAQALRAALA